MYTVQISLNIENEVKTIQYDAKTSAVFQSILDIYRNENWLVSTLVIDKLTANRLFTWKNENKPKPIDNLARLFLIDYWIEGDIRNNKLIYDDSKIWDIVR